MEFERSQVDECVFYIGKTIYIVYTDDSILVWPDKQEIEQVIKYLKKANLEVTDEGKYKDGDKVHILSER